MTKEAPLPDEISAMSFETALAELETIVSHLESGDVSLESSIEKQLAMKESVEETPPELLRWLARQPDKKGRLLDICLDILGRSPTDFNWYQASTAVTAGSLLGNVFRGDSETCHRIRGIITRVYEGHHGSEVRCIETSCESTGKSSCVFIIEPETME